MFVGHYRIADRAVDVVYDSGHYEVVEIIWVLTNTHPQSLAFIP